MTKTIVSFLLLSLLSIPAFSQPGWESRAVGTADTLDPDWVVLIMDPDIASNDRNDYRYKRIKLIDLLSGLIRFPDELTRYVAVHNRMAFTTEQLTGQASVVGFAKGVRVPFLPDSASISMGGSGYIAVSVPVEDNRWSGWFGRGTDTDNPGSRDLERFSRSPNLDFEKDGVSYEVWMSYMTPSYGSGRFETISSWELPSIGIYFDERALAPDPIPEILFSNPPDVVRGNPVTMTVRISDEPAREMGDPDISVRWRTSSTLNTFLDSSTGLLTFAYNESEKTVSVPTKLAPDETEDPVRVEFGGRLTHPIGAKFRSSQVHNLYGPLMTFTLHKVAPLFLSYVVDDSVEEGGSITARVRLGAEIPGGFTLTPTYVGSGDNPATPGVDFTQNTAAITFVGNDNEFHDFIVQTTEDTDVEEDETFDVVFNQTVAGLAPTVSRTFTIIDDDE